MENKVLPEGECIYRCEKKIEEIKSALEVATSPSGTAYLEKWMWLEQSIVAHLRELMELKRT